MPVIRYSIALIILSISAASGFAAGEVKLRLTLQRPINNPAGQNILDFKREVESRSKSAAKVEVKEQLQAPVSQSAMQALRDGTVEMSVVSLAELSKDIAGAGIFTLPFLFNFDAIVHAAARPGSEIRNIIDAEIKMRGAQVLWWQPYGSTVIFSKGTPILHPKDLANHNTAVTDALSAEFIRMCGGAPQVVNDTDDLRALDNTNADSMMSSISSVRNYNNAAKVDKINNVRYSESLYVVVISNKIWRGLTPELRKTIADAARSAEEQVWEQLAQTEAEAYDLALQKGMTFETPSDDDILAWRACSSSIVEAFVNRSEFIGAKLLAAYGKLRSDPCCSQALQTQTGD